MSEKKHKKSMGNYLFANVLHVNYPNTRDEIYCRRLHKLMKFDIKTCEKCPIIAGSAQGNGVECYYYDAISKYEAEPIVNPPHQEYLRISKLIDSGLVHKAATRK